MRLERRAVIKGLNAALAPFAGVYSNGPPARKRGKMSLAGRKRIAAAERVRWAKVSAKQKG
jgi:hypothetical protein